MRQLRMAWRRLRRPCGFPVGQIQTQRVYLSLGDREEHTKNQPMAAVDDNIRALHSALTQRGKDCRLEWNAGGHFKDANLRTARAFAWTMESEK